MNMARENDVILIYIEENPVSFARIESIEPDVKRDWYNITMLMLQVPLQTVTWTLKDLYINGEEFFMGGKRMKIEVVESPEQTALEENLPKEASPESHGNVISFADMRAKIKNTSKQP